MLAKIDNLIDATEMLEKMQNRKDGDSGFFGTFLIRYRNDAIILQNDEHYGSIVRLSERNFCRKVVLLRDNRIDKTYMEDRI